MSATISLQRCNDCARPQYPMRELCGHCLSPNISMTNVDAHGTLLSWTRLHASMEPYFHDQLPCLVGEVRLVGDVMIMAHLDLAPGNPPPQSGMSVRLSLRPALDDQPAYFATPEQGA